MSNVVPIPRRGAQQIGFDRIELNRILDLYGRMVAAGQWRDYAMDFGKDAASFSAFRRAAERPQVRIEKCPALRNRQGILLDNLLIFISAVFLGAVNCESSSV